MLLTLSLGLTLSLLPLSYAGVIVVVFDLCNIIVVVLYYVAPSAICVDDVAVDTSMVYLRDVVIIAVTVVFAVGVAVDVVVVTVVVGVVVVVVVVVMLLLLMLVAVWMLLLLMLVV